MNVLVVGDVHGCYHTFRELVEANWNPEQEVLVQLGDLIDRGNFVPRTLQYARELKEQYGEQVVFLKGNHEFEWIEHVLRGPNDNWLRQCGQDTLDQLAQVNMEYETVTSWVEALSLVWENDHVFISHAGVSLAAHNPLLEDSEVGVLWNRTPLKDIGKLQIIGHTPCKSGKPEYDESSHTWNIDTGVYKPNGLSAIRVSLQGEVLQLVYQPTEEVDVTS
ncbi:serine/threonine protein phosphatase [Paenibacillus sp. N1-5-1-14]|uniref:metallophosphoesterase family protein n=1 Tax=Paenibacillus radicibacter TaxID=2972488 RepID=UPI002158DD69|nr:metallophosphoesterase family protein [Paenibacillus radicibacter]MCR8642720.1 serine/threonine protein phosphatase [Paenibacillus radicibacter]